MTIHSDDDGDALLQVWLYDPREIGRNACCVSKRKFTDVFPMENERDPDPLTGKIDAIFYSYPYHTTLILKQETVYEVGSYYSRAGSTNGAGSFERWRPGITFGSTFVMLNDEQLYVASSLLSPSAGTRCMTF